MSLLAGQAAEGGKRADSSLDEGFDEFLAVLRGASRSFSGDPSVSLMRESAAAARKPFNQGGPGMAETADVLVPAEGSSLRMRLYRPGRREKATPAMIYLHGGGWTMLGLDTHDRLMREYAAASGWTVAALDYPLAPETRFPRTVAVCAGVFRHLAAQSSKHGLDPQKLVLGGDSSGANLALAAALSLRDQGGSQPVGLLLNYGVFDCDLARPSYARFGAEPYQLTPEKMAWFWCNYCPDEAKRADPLASPLNADLSALPPVHLVIAGQDVLRDENRALAAKLQKAGIRVSADTYPGAPHAFLEAVALAPTSRRAVEKAARWLHALEDGGGVR